MKNKFNDNVVLIQVSSLNLEDDFMKYEPKTSTESDLMSCLTNVMQSKRNFSDFYCFVRGPLCSDAGIIVGYTLIPDSLNGVTYYEWQRAAKALEPDKRSRIGRKDEYALMLAASIKMLINKGWDKEEAWDAICNNPEKILQIKDDSPEILLLTNLLKTRKILADDYIYRDVAFYIAQTDESFFSINSVAENISEYDYVVNTYFSDYTPPSTGNPYQDQLNQLSTYAPDVKREKRNEIAWIIMDVD